MASNVTKMSSMQPIEWVKGTTNDGRVYRVLISQIEVRRMIFRAQDNKTTSCTAGPVTVKISER